MMVYLILFWVFFVGGLPYLKPVIKNVVEVYDEMYNEMCKLLKPRSKLTPAQRLFELENKTRRMEYETGLVFCGVELLDGYRQDIGSPAWRHHIYCQAKILKEQKAKGGLNYAISAWQLKTSHYKYRNL